EQIGTLRRHQRAHHRTPGMAQQDDLPLFAIADQIFRQFDAVLDDAIQVDVRRLVATTVTEGMAGAALVPLHNREEFLPGHIFVGVGPLHIGGPAMHHQQHGIGEIIALDADPLLDPAQRHVLCLVYRLGRFGRHDSRQHRGPEQARDLAPAPHNASLAHCGRAGWTAGAASCAARAARSASATAASILGCAAFIAAAIFSPICASASAADTFSPIRVSFVALAAASSICASLIALATTSPICASLTAFATASPIWSPRAVCTATLRLARACRAALAAGLTFLRVPLDGAPLDGG